VFTDPDEGYPKQWSGFKRDFLTDGGLLKIPVYATSGNHDYYPTFGTPDLSDRNFYVNNQLRNLYGPYICHESPNGNIYYSMNLDSVHLVSLGRYADGNVLNWLANDLNSSTGPVVMFLHYGLKEDAWYNEGEIQELWNTIEPYRQSRSIFFLNGHTHNSESYQAGGCQVFDAGSMRWNNTFGEFGVMDITTGGSLAYTQFCPSGGYVLNNPGYTVDLDPNYLDVKWTYGGGEINIFKCFVDLDEDGQMDEGEDPLANWQFLFENSYYGIKQTAFSDDDGMITLDLPPGSYQITETVPPGWRPTTPRIVSYELTAGGTANILFGDIIPEPATLSLLALGGLALLRRRR
jgi:hypothetical protein